jgi:BirA family biotin operon repressor/biotin-[acetyl-CoA-carboxylase] ligase
LADSDEWRVRKGSAGRRFSDRLVVQSGRPGILELSVCLLAGGKSTPGGLGVFRLLAAACASEGIRRDTGIVSWLHWPNLVTIDGRVVAKASLSLAALDTAGKTQATIGISVNCSAGNPSDFPSALPSTSILEALGVEIDVDLLRDKILHALYWYEAEWEGGMHRKLVERMRPTIAWLGQNVEVKTTSGQLLRGTAKGLDDLGSLLLEQSRKTRTLPPGGVELVREVN